MSVYNDFWADKVLSGLNAMYGLAFDRSGKTVGMLKSKALRPEDVSHKVYFWKGACAFKKQVQLLGDEHTIASEQDFNLNLHALMALHSLHFTPVITGGERAQQTLTPDNRISKEEVFRCWSLDAQADSPLWMMQQAGIAHDTIRQDEEYYYLNYSQMQKIIRFMTGADKKSLIASEKTIFPQDEMAVFDQISFEDYRRICPLATQIMGAHLWRHYPRYHEAIPYLAEHFQAIDDTAIVNRWADETEKSKKRSEAIESALLERLNKEHTYEREATAWDYGRSLKADAMTSIMLPAREEYKGIIKAFMAMKGLEFSTCVESLKNDKGKTENQPALIIEKSLILPIAKNIDPKCNAKDVFEKIGIDNRYVRTQLANFNNSNPINPGQIKQYFVISGQQNIDRLKALGAKILDTPELVAAEKLFEENAITRASGVHEDIKDEVPNNVVSFAEIRAQKLEEAKGNKR